MLVIGAAPSFTLTASNGGMVALTPETRKWTVDDDSASLTYRAEYSKPGTLAPFEKMTGALTVSADDCPANTFTFSLQPGGTGLAMQESPGTRVEDGRSRRVREDVREGARRLREEDGGRRRPVSTREMEAMTANPAP